MTDNTSPETFKELDTFLNFLSEKEKEYFKEPKTQIINLERLKDFKNALYQITKIIKDTNPDAKINYILNNDFCVGHGAIEIETDEISVTNVKQFIESIKLANNFEIHPLLNGNLSMSVSFHGMTDEL